MRCSMVVPNRIEVGGLVDGRLFFRIPAHSSSPFPSMALIVLSPRKHHRLMCAVPGYLPHLSAIKQSVCTGKHLDEALRDVGCCAAKPIQVCIGFKLNQCPLDAFSPFHTASYVVKLLSSRHPHLLS